MINVDTHDHSVDPIHVLSTDLLMAPGLPVNYTKTKKKEWRPIFFPKEYVKEHEEITTDGFKLQQRKLERIGGKVTQTQKEIREKAERLTEE